MSASDETAIEPGLPGGVQLTDEEIIKDPFPLYAEMQRSCPVAHAKDVGWVVSRYEDVRSTTLNTDDLTSSIAGDDGPKYMGVSPEPWSDEVAALVAQYEPMQNALFTADPPIHTRQRAIVTKALHPRRMRQLEGAMRQIANELVDSFIDEGKCELHSQFGVPLPLTVIADTLGISRDDLADFKYWSDCMIAGDLDPMNNEQRAEVAKAVIVFQKYMIPLIEDRRANPKDDLLSDLANSEITDDELAEADQSGGQRRLTTGEILPILSQILLAGNETTTSLIGNALVVLMQNPDMMAEVRADQSLIPRLLEESLRYEPPAMAIYRRANIDMEIAGQKIAAGDMVVPSIAAACRDANVFENPHTFDLHRSNVRKHVAFGVGAHFCPGAEMARVEARVAFEVLFDRLDDIQLANDTPLEVYPTFTVRGYQKIPITFTARK